jgi:hypothetical protein
VALEVTAILAQGDTGQNTKSVCDSSFHKTVRRNQVPALFERSAKACFSGQGIRFMSTCQ